MAETLSLSSGSLDPACPSRVPARVPARGATRAARAQPRPGTSCHYSSSTCSELEIESSSQEAFVCGWSRVAGLGPRRMLCAPTSPGEGRVRTCHAARLRAICSNRNCATIVAHLAQKYRRLGLGRRGHPSTNLRSSLHPLPSAAKGAFSGTRPQLSSTMESGKCKAIASIHLFIYSREPPKDCRDHV